MSSILLFIILLLTLCESFDDHCNICSTINECISACSCASPVNTSWKDCSTVECQSYHSDCAFYNSYSRLCYCCNSCTDDIFTKSDKNGVLDNMEIYNSSSNASINDGSNSNVEHITHPSSSDENDTPRYTLLFLLGVGVLFAVVLFGIGCMCYYNCVAYKKHNTIVGGIAKSKYFEIEIHAETLNDTDFETEIETEPEIKTQIETEI